MKKGQGCRLCSLLEKDDANGSFITINQSSSGATTATIVDDEEEIEAAGAGVRSS